MWNEAISLLSYGTGASVFGSRLEAALSFPFFKARELESPEQVYVT